MSDDESDITLTFEWILRGEGCEVDSFNDPQAALSNFSLGIYDIALIDVKMPKMDGIYLYRKLKNIDDNVKYCLITAYGVPYDTLKRDHPDLDVEWFIRKPISIEQLVNEIRSKLHS